MGAEEVGGTSKKDGNDMDLWFEYQICVDERLGVIEGNQYRSI